ncbi:hypothetical protein ACER0C_004941 [Sarotherodon galilaeus]
MGADPPLAPLLAAGGAAGCGVCGPGSVLGLCGGNRINLLCLIRDQLSPRPRAPGSGELIRGQRRSPAPTASTPAVFSFHST